MGKSKPTPPGHDLLKHPENKLIVTRQASRPLTKAQQEFNRLVKSIEKLQARLRDESANLDELLVAFEKLVHPRRLRLQQIRKDLIHAMKPFVEPGRLKKKDQKTLAQLISWQLDEVIRMDGSLPEDFRALFEQVNGMTIEEAEKQDVAEAQAEIKEMLEAFGVEVDLSELRPDMNSEEMSAATARISSRLSEESRKLEEEPQPDNRRRKKGEKEKQEKLRQAEKLREEARKKSLSKIYRDLARVLHPDLEPDESVRPRKAELMAKLATAYHNNDLHTLLMLELEWMEREEGDLARLTEEKLAIYNQVLKEQAKDLQSQISELPLHSRYGTVVSSHPLYGHKVMRVDEEIRQLNMILDSMESTLKSLNGPGAMREILTTLKDYRASMRDSQ